MTRIVPTIVTLVMACVLLVCGHLPATAVLAQDITNQATRPADNPATPQVANASPARAIPAHRVSQNVAIISIKGTVEGERPTSPSMTAQTVERRIAIAEREGADAIVFEIDSEIGSHDACSRIAEMIRESTIKRTFAWVRSKAIGNSAMIALACREIIAADGAELGGINILDFRGNRYRTPQPVQFNMRQTKLALSAVEDARKHNDALGAYVRDETLALAMSVGDFPLWWVRNSTTGDELALDASELLLLLPNIKPDGAGVARPIDLPGVPRLPPSRMSLASPHPDLPAGSPTFERIANDYAGEATSLVTLRVLPGRESRNQWSVVAKITAGNGAFVLDAQQLAMFRLASNRVLASDGSGNWALQGVNSDDDLKAFLGATKVGRLTPTISDGMMAVLAHPFTRMVLIGIFFAAMFLEFLKPGTLIGAVLSATALVLFIFPAYMLGLANWWEVFAIIAGVVLLAIEVFVLPGFGFPGIAGLVLLMGGLASTFLPQGKGMFSSGFIANGGLTSMLWAGLLVIGAILTAAVVMWLLIKQIGEIPLFRKLVLTSDDEVTPGTLFSTDMQNADAFVRVGDEGITLTRMTPAGRVEMNGRIIDAVAEGSLIDAQKQVHVVSIDGIRVGVAPGARPDVSHANDLQDDNNQPAS